MAGRRTTRLVVEADTTSASVLPKYTLLLSGEAEKFCPSIVMRFTPAVARAGTMADMEGVGGTV